MGDLHKINSEDKKKKPEEMGKPALGKRRNTAILEKRKETARKRKAREDTAEKGKDTKEDNPKKAWWHRWFAFRKKVWKFRWHLTVFIFILLMVFLFLWSHKPMEIDTAKPEYAPDASCSIFIYMCGSNLETKQGLGGKNIDELLSVELPKNMNVVLETGGADKWRSHGISNKNLQRYLVKDRELVLLEELPDASMGAVDTLRDFLHWGTTTYPADRNLLVFWDHGSSAADGLCYDEKHGNDCLTRTELASAFADAGLMKKLDLVIFDTCFMGSLETAYIVKDYAYYMIASQNIVPAGGLDYAVLARELSANDDEAFGRLLCDAFLDKCRRKGQDSEAQLSLYALGATSALLDRFNDACFELHIRQKVADGSRFKNRVSEKENIENSMIGRSASESVVIHTAKVNVVDLTNFLASSFGVDLVSQRKRVAEVMEKFLLYEVHGEGVENLGVSLYYPVTYDREQLGTYLAFCPSEQYRMVLETIYANVPAQTLAFADRGSISEEGDFCISLTEESHDYLGSISYRLWKQEENKYNAYTLLGADGVDIYDDNSAENFETLHFDSSFGGEWYFLGGMPLLTAVLSQTKAAFFKAPIAVNGEDTEYSFQCARTKKEKLEIRYGTYGASYDEYGLPERSFSGLRVGDEVNVFTATDGVGKALQKEKAFQVEQDLLLPERLPLPEGRYRYQFTVFDIYGSSISSDYAIFEVKGEGENRTVTAVQVMPAWG